MCVLDHTGITNSTFLVLFDKILGLEMLLGSEDLWPVLLGLTVVPTVLQMGLLPFCPESPRFLYIIRSQEHHAKSGESHNLFLETPLCRSIVWAPPICPLNRLEEVNRPAGGGWHASRDEGGEEEDGHGEESLHPGALPLPSLPPAHRHLHPAAALPAALWSQCSESDCTQWWQSINQVSKLNPGLSGNSDLLNPASRFSTTPPESSWRQESRVRSMPQ